MAFDQLIDHGEIVSVGLVRHDPASRHHLKLSAKDQSERKKDLERILEI